LREGADQAAREAATAAEAALKELKWQHDALQEKHAALQAQFESLSTSHEKLKEAHAELRDREAEHSAEARAERRAGEVKDAFLAHLKQQNEEWRSHSIAVLELKKDKDKDKKEKELR
jgi:vacuolar-type H+-ATPase subunit D/Vma8